MSKLFIANSGSDDITIINGNNDTALSPTIPSTSDPVSVCVLPNNNFVYIAELSSNEVKKYDVATNALVATISLPTFSQPNGTICAHPSSLFIYVTCPGMNSVCVIDVTTDTVVTSIVVGDSPYGICCLPNGNKVYVTNGGDGTVSVIDTSTLLVVGLPIIVGAGVVCVCSGVISSGFVYVTNIGGQSISKIDTSTDTVVSTLSLPFGPNGVVSSKDDAFIYASTNDTHVFKISTATFLLDTDITSVAGIGIDIDGTDSKVYVVSNFVNTVTVIDRTTNAVLKTINVGVSPVSLGNFISNFDIIDNGVDKQFLTSSIITGTNTTLRFTFNITNPYSFSFSDALPSGLIFKGLVGSVPVGWVSVLPVIGVNGTITFSSVTPALGIYVIDVLISNVDGMLNASCELIPANFTNTLINSVLPINITPLFRDVCLVVLPLPSTNKKRGCCDIYVDSNGNRYNLKKGGPILSGRYNFIRGPV